MPQISPMLHTILIMITWSTLISLFISNTINHTSIPHIKEKKHTSKKW